MDFLTDAFPMLAEYPQALLGIAIVVLVLLAWLADRLTQLVLLRVIARLVRATRATWDDALLDRGVVGRLAHVVPALVIHAGVPLLPHVPAGLAQVARNVAAAYVVLTVAMSAARLLTVVNGLYEQRNPDKARARPIKGYVQVAQLLIYIVAAVLIVATLVDRSPLLLLSGLGAMTAVLMLVFKDTIMSLVAGVQLSSNDMLRVGDWIEMPALGADGDVIDIALHTVKVQNWDKTITTIPTHRLISETYRNWRGMQESGGRRIKRAIHIDQSSVRFLAPQEVERLHRFAVIDDYLDRKHEELEAWNTTLLAEGKDPVNTRRVTNLGTFRAYVQAYLDQHPGINHEMTCMVRQLQPGATGIPLELYCFASTVRWVPYENVQSDIFDHLLAILPEFGLRVFQQPTGADVREVLARTADGPPSS